MKTKKRLLILALISMLTTNGAFSQLDIAGDLLTGGVNDGAKLLNAYLEPIGKGWGYDLAAGWYNTAKPHNTLGFDLTFSFNFALIPETSKTFDISNLGLEVISGANSSNAVFPTIANGDIENSFQIVRTVDDGSGNDHTFTLLPPTKMKGISIPFIPLPVLNGSIGIIKNTDIAFRYIPSTKMGDLGNIGMWGLGIKHDFLQWLPIVDKVPFLNASVFVGYSKLDFSFGIPYTPPAVDNPDNYVNPKDQKLEASLNALHAAVLVGVNLPIISPYVSLGITNSNMNMDILGEFAIPNLDTNPGATFGETSYQLIPENSLPKMEFKNSFAPSVAAGLRLKFAVVTIYGQYTLQEYSTVSAGLGISFR
jgi:hypothetical protein